MKYQIQKYKSTDHDDRVVVARIEGQLTEQQLNQWYHDSTKELEIPETHQCALVPENNPWFFQEEKDTKGELVVNPQGTPGTNENLRNQQDQKTKPVEGTQRETSELLVAEAQNRLKERAARIRRKQEEKKLLAELRKQR